MRAVYSLHCAHYTRQSLSLDVWRAGECLAARKEPSDIFSILQEPPGLSVHADDFLVVLPVGLHCQIPIILSVPPSIALLASRQHDLHTALAH